MKLSLYYYDSCPFCRIVLQELAFLQLEVEKRNILSEPAHYEALLQGGGRSMVPCLLIENHESDGSDSKEWMYESREIISFLRGVEKTD